MKGQQLPLAVQLRETASFESFHAGPNAEALQALRTADANLLLYGPPAAGKTHLLQASARGVSGAAYLPLSEFTDYGAEALAGYAAVNLLCLDDLEAVSQQRDWCLALLRLLDALRTRGARYLIAAGAPPERLDLAVPDLRTRLKACAVYGLRPLDDEDRRQLLQIRAAARGLELGDEVSHWLLTRLNRDTGSLLAALDELDRAALSAKRRLTLPFVQRVLAPESARTTPAH